MLSEIAVIVPFSQGILEIHMEIAQEKYVVEIKNGRNEESWESPEWECWAEAGAQLSHRLYLVNNNFSKAYYVNYN